MVGSVILIPIVRRAWCRPPEFCDGEAEDKLWALCEQSARRVLLARPPEPAEPEEEGAAHDLASAESEEERTMRTARPAANPRLGLR